MKIFVILHIQMINISREMLNFTERPDLPRTLYSAFGEYEGTMNEALQTCSPIHLAEQMPDIPYTIFHCEADKAVNLEKHSVRFVKKMKESHRIVLKTVPFRGHCDLSPEMTVEFFHTIRSYFD